MSDEKDNKFGEIDRRGLLKCGAWAGAGVLWTIRGGIATGAILGEAAAATAHRAADFSFVQISDTHIGFNKPANPDPIGTLNQAIAKIKALPTPPAFVIHTGDITHTSTPEQFDNARQLLSALGTQIHFTPGEHDTQDENNGREFLNHFGQGARGDGWYSFDHNGTHFIATVNVVHLTPGSGLGSFGADQIAWIRDDVAHLPSSTPIVLFGHMPMWTLYEQWGWGTNDSAAAFAPLRRFGSVTVLNGHVHQVQQHVEGNITFHTARSTAYPQPQPGAAPSPGPLTVPAAQLPGMIGMRSVRVVRGHGALAIADQTLQG